jgi:hypothetical protein
MGHPTIYPTGVTLYHPDLAWNGYTLLQAQDLGALLIDMNGREVQLWKDLQGFPNKLLPGGQVFGSTGRRDPRHGLQDQLDLVQVDWDGNVVWRFDRHEFISDPDSPARWVARQHHDYQRQGNPVGYYAPGQTPQTDNGNTLLLVHKTVSNAEISPHPLVDDAFIEVDWQGNIIWQWHAHQHFEQLGFDPAALHTLAQDPNLRPVGGGLGDWLHINTLSQLGPNRWYDAGDSRFHPDNLIWDSREANIIAIVDKASGDIVWKLGPRFDQSAAEQQLGWIIGPHHAHLIPRGLPGEGNILVFDNGGWAGYGEPNPGAPSGRQNALRDYSRVLEIDPVSLAIVWQYTPAEAGFDMPLDAARFYSPFVSGAQRLPNGNTLITEGSDGRVFEVTADHQIVWEFISPYRGRNGRGMNMVYRAYRAPYDWVPQLPTPQQSAIEPLDSRTFRVPGASSERLRETAVAGVSKQVQPLDYCVISR